MFNADISQPQPSMFEQHPFWLKLCLAVMFLLAALIRRDEIKAPGHLLDREYTSAIFARAFYLMSNPQVEDWRRDFAVTTMNQQPVLEPPLVEYLVSLFILTHTITFNFSQSSLFVLPPALPALSLLCKPRLESSGRCL